MKVSETEVEQHKSFYFELLTITPKIGIFYESCTKISNCVLLVFDSLCSKNEITFRVSVWETKSNKQQFPIPESQKLLCDRNRNSIFQIRSIVIMLFEQRT